MFVQSACARRSGSVQSLVKEKTAQSKLNHPDFFFFVIYLFILFYFIFFNHPDFFLVFVVDRSSWMFLID